MQQPTLETLTHEQWATIHELDRYVRFELKFESRDLCYFFLLRFANARNFDVPETKKMLQEYTAYYNGIVGRQLESWKPTDPDLVELTSKIPIGFSFCSKNGYPVLIYRLGQIDFKTLLKKYSVERIVDYHAQLGFRFMNIILPIASAAAKRRIEKLYVIVDAKDAEILTLLHGKPKEFVKRFAEAGQLYFPNILQKLYIVNAPMLFSAFWSVAKHFLHPTTQERIEISSGLHKERLHQEMDPKHLPPYLGGTSQVDISLNPGPWRTALVESYALESFFPKDDSQFNEYFLTKAERKSLDNTTVTIKANVLNTMAISFQDLNDIHDDVVIRRVKTARMIVCMSPHGARRESSLQSNK